MLYIISVFFHSCIARQRVPQLRSSKSNEESTDSDDYPTWNTAAPTSTVVALSSSFPSLSQSGIVRISLRPLRVGADKQTGDIDCYRRGRASLANEDTLSDTAVRHSTVLDFNGETLSTRTSVLAPNVQACSATFATVVHHNEDPCIVESTTTDDSQCIGYSHFTSTCSQSAQLGTPGDEESYSGTSFPTSTSDRSTGTISTGGSVADALKSSNE